VSSLLEGPPVLLQIMISKYVLALASLCLFVATPALAATTTAPTTTTPVAQTVSTVGFKEVRITKQKDRTFDISFSLVNGTQPEPQVKYAIVLTPGTSGGAPADVKVYDEVVRLSAGDLESKTISYTPPAAVKGGAYMLLLEARTTNGYMLTTTLVGSVTLTDDPRASVAIDVLNCRITVGTDTVRYSLGQGVDILPSEVINANCVVKNTSDKSVTATPMFTTYHRSRFGAQVGTSALSAFTLGAGESKKISLPIPKADKPQAYDAVLTFTDEAGTLSNAAVFHYVLAGTSATIQQTSLDKTYYESGEYATLKLYWTASADSFRYSRLEQGTPLLNPVADIQLKSSGGRACADPQKVPLTENRLTVDIPVTKDCTNPEVVVSIVSSDTTGKEVILDSQTVSFASSGGVAGAAATVTVSLLIMIALIGYLVYRKKQQQIVPTALIVLFVAGMLSAASFSMPVRHATAFEAWRPLDNNVTTISWRTLFGLESEHEEISAFFTTSKDTYYTTESIVYLTKYSTSDVCLNLRAAPVVRYVRIIDSSDRTLWESQYPAEGVVIPSRVRDGSIAAEQQEIAIVNTHKTLPIGVYNVEAYYYVLPDAFSSGANYVIPDVKSGEWLDCRTSGNVSGPGTNPNCLLANVPAGRGYSGKIVIPIKVIAKPEYGVCGSAHTIYPSGATSYGSDSFCAAGSPHSRGGAPRSVLPFPPPGATVSWKCSGSFGGSWSPTCRASVPREFTPTAGVCGSASRAYPVGSNPYGTDAFCSIGSPVTSAGTPFGSIPPPTPSVFKQWYCSGIDGGDKSPLCRASIDTEGVCGPAARLYHEGVDTAYPTDPTSYCTSGVAWPSPNFPLPGQSEQWTCLGTSDINDLCTARLVEREKPDLRTSKVSRTTAVAGKPETFPVVITNFPNVDTSESPEGNGGFDNVLLRANQKSDGSGPDLTTVRGFSDAVLAVVSMAPLSSKTITFTAKFDGSDAEQTRYVKACADTPVWSDIGKVNSIVETSETNNCGDWQPVNVTASPAACDSRNGTPCGDTYSCNGVDYRGTFNCLGVCEPPIMSCSLIPTANIYADPERVKKGNSTNITWDSQNTTVCRIEGSNGTRRTGLKPNSADETPPGRSDVINTQTIYDIYCNGSSEILDSVVVNILPVFEVF